MKILKLLLFISLLTLLSIVSYNIGYDIGDYYGFYEWDINYDAFEK